MQPLPFEKRAPGQRVAFVVTRENNTPITYRGTIEALPDGHPLAGTGELVYVRCDEQYYWLNNHRLMTFWDFDIENGFGNTSPLYSEEDFDCKHPPARQYWWTAFDGTLCGGCCDCGEVLHGGAN